MSVIYNLLVGPLQLIFEVIFAFANRFFENPGYSIIFLSLAMNFLVLPLYKRADAMQAEERETEQKLKPWVDHIKKTFKGDERFMMLQTFYRQNNYKPTDALKGSVSLLLEIPFFIAAYRMLSSLQLLQGVEFGPIKDLGAPDQMFMIGAFAVNVLPILMTVINVVSGVIYTKGMSAKSKIQLFGMAAIFLVLLYNSPAGLVFYWTLNNLFSLAKNIFYKIKNPKLVLSVLSSICGIGVLIAGIFVHPMDTTKKQLAIVVFAVALQLPIILYFLNKSHKAAKEVEITKKDKISFFLGGIFVALLTGVLIPSDVISASPTEFINLSTLENPLHYILNSFMFAVGAFVIWFGIFYMLASNKGKKVMGFFMWALAGVGTVDYIFFGKNYSNLTPKLGFDVTPNATAKEQIINMVVILAIVVVFYLIWRYKQGFVRFAYATLCIAVVGLSITNIAKSQTQITEQFDRIESVVSNDVNLPLSKDGKNVVVIMMDRAIGCQLPYILQEKPELKEKLGGFTYYPNTISYGAHTNFGSPALYGGYEYTPEATNKRNDRPLVENQNEALKVMPELFHNEGYEVTIGDPSYAGYTMIPDLSAFDEYNEYSDFHRFNMMGQIDVNSGEESSSANENKLNRNFFCYSLFKISPVFVQPTIYSNGVYNDPDMMYAKPTGLPPLNAAGVQQKDSTTTASGFSYLFLRAYYALSNYSNITTIKDTDKPSFIMITNDTSHEPEILQTPNYEPQAQVDNTQYFEEHKDDYVIDGKKLDMSNTYQVSHYHSNMATILQLTKWFDYLREMGVYDNTKIIIVADHGCPMEQYEGLPQMYDEYLMAYNPLLLVKDFNTTNKEIISDDTFMTNGDVPTLALDGVVENPVNPFTGNPITSDAKQGEQHICVSHNWNTDKNNGTQFKEENGDPVKWLSVHDNIFDLDNWKEYVPAN